MAFALIASTTAQSTDALSVTTSAIDTTGAKLIVLSVAVSWTISSANLPVVTDSKGNTWTQLAWKVFAGTNTHEAMFYCSNPTVGSGHTFTKTGGDPDCASPTLQVAAFSGQGTLGGSVGTTGTAVGGVNVSCGSLTPDTNGSLLLTGLSTGLPNGGNSGYSCDNGYTSIAANYSSQAMGGGMAWLVQGTAGAINPNWVAAAGPNTYFAINHAWFRPVSSGNLAAANYYRQMIEA